jgi:hypothetical protein
MDNETRRDMILLGCAVGGIAIGAVLRHRRRGDPIDLTELLGGSIAAAGAAVALAARLADTVGLDKRDERARGLLTFGAAAGLSLMGDRLSDIIPGH